MTNDLNSVAPAAPASRSHSRRTVLRAGAHAAWAVPAVQIATMVPAMATSGSPSVTLIATKVTANALLGTTEVQFAASVTGTGSVTGLKVTVSNATAPSDQPMLRAGLGGLLASSGSVVSGPFTGSGTGVGPYTFTHTGGSISSGQSTSFVVRFGNCNTSPAKHRKITATPTADPTVSALIPATIAPFN